MKTCYIFAASEGLPRAFNPEKDDIIIAADAGILNLEKIGAVADIAVGDFDSLGFVPDCGEIIRHPVMKDDTDTMLAVKTGLARGYRRFIIYGGAGGRADHTLANYQTLCFAANMGAEAYMCCGDYYATAVCNGTVNFKPGLNGTVSVFSFGESRGVTLNNLLYPLDNAVVSPYVPIGVSNSFTEKPAEITVTQGTLFVMWYGTEKCISEIKQNITTDK